MEPASYERLFQVCAAGEELAEEIVHGSWTLDHSFLLGDICFVNQVDGGVAYKNRHVDWPSKSTRPTTVACQQPTATDEGADGPENALLELHPFPSWTLVLHKVVLRT